MEVKLSALDTVESEVIIVQCYKYKACSNETRSMIIVCEGVVAVKNSSSGRSGRHSSEAPDYETLKK
jgi:hypothetical protein